MSYSEFTAQLGSAAEQADPSQALLGGSFGKVPHGRGIAMSFYVMVDGAWCLAHTVVGEGKLADVLLDQAPQDRSLDNSEDQSEGESA